MVESMNLLFLSKAIKYYKQKNILNAILKEAEDREVSVRYFEGFGKRPDIILYEDDILSQVRKRATSFHISEERWSNPLLLKPALSKRELDELRIGWDLVLDIDCPDWEFSKLTTYLFLKALLSFKVKNISLKFSGNKGFHIAVPFEEFPEEVNGFLVKNLFPEAPRAISKLLLLEIENKFIKVKDNIIFFDKVKKIHYDELKKRFNKDNLIKLICPKCGSERKVLDKKKIFICSCGYQKTVDEDIDYLKCPKCGSFMNEFSINNSCSICGSKEKPTPKFNVSSIIEVDTILLASRHLFRAPYSLHEKSGLSSVVIGNNITDPSIVLSFKKEEANPKNIIKTKEFIIRRKNNLERSASDLLLKSLRYNVAVDKEEKYFEPPEDAIPEKYFPPCIKNILKGLDDGRKRSMFILTNFLRCSGYTLQNIKDILYEWNKRNKEPLRETVIKSHLKSKENKKPILPPNCDSDYYTGLRLCFPDDLCKYCKNPVQYARKKLNFKNNFSKKKEKEKIEKKK